MGRTWANGKRSLSVLDQLESRRLLSDVNVVNFGAVPNDGRDDLGAINSAMNASKDGDRIYFPAGTYNLSNQIFLKGNRSYVGADGAVIQGDNGNHIFHVQQDNTTIQNFTLQGKPIMIDTPSGNMVSNLTINDNVIRNTGTGAENNAITFTTGLRNSTISNNTIDGLGPMGIYGYYWDHLTIANNSFLNGGQGMHVDDLGRGSPNMTIEQNLFSGIHRMGVEYQGAGKNLVLQDNWYEKPSMTSNFHDNDATFAFSIVADRSSGTLAQRNVIWAPERPDGVGVRIGFETGGDNTVIQNNYVYGINQVLANTDGTGSTSVLAQNNYYSNTLDGLVGRGLTQINNGSQVNLQWLINRGKPGPNQRWTDPSNPNGGTTTTTPQQQPTTPPPAIDQPAVSGTTYLSDMNWASMSNGWGSAEKDHSNGEQGSNDGRTITLNGKTYAKGIGAHANSTIVYNLNGQYSRFQSDVGVDDESGSNGSITFQVYADNVKIFDSGTMNGSSSTQSINVDVSGKSQLKLVISDSGNGNANDHGDWANAQLTSGGSTSTPSTPPPSNGSAAWLSDLNWTSATNGWGPVEKDHSNGELGGNDGRTISLRSSTYAKGLGVHASSDVRYNLNGQYSTFKSDLGVDNETSGNGSVDFQVWVDGVLKYDSGTVRGTDAIKQVSISVAGAKELRLVVNPADSGNAFDHADWAGAQLLA